ncbi:MAG: TrmO family methyltransferase [Bacteroidales bacterium]
MASSFILEPVGFVHNQASIRLRPGRIKQQISEIKLYDEYLPGLEGIEKHAWLTVVFGLDRVEEIHLTEPLALGGRCGIFACRSQYRPNRLGITTCRLLKVEGTLLTLQGLDAADGSPVFDLKCPDTSEQEQQLIHRSVLLQNPRHDIQYDIRNHTPYLLWIKAGQLTGTLTTGLALGVMAALHFMELSRSRGWQNDLFSLSVPADSALTDGVLFVSGITPGSGRFYLQHPSAVFTFKASFASVSYELVTLPADAVPVKEWIEEDAEQYFKIKITGV